MDELSKELVELALSSLPKERLARGFIVAGLAFFLMLCYDEFIKGETNNG